jgi:protein-S-isoprenylcysteine O-methyltransferase Ste14
MSAEQYAFLGFGWLAWCMVHSLLITPSVTRRLRRLPGSVNRYFRLGYNITALGTLLPLVIYTFSLQGGSVFAWRGGWTVLRFCLLVISFWMFYGGARRYDMGYFLGLKQISSRKNQTLLTEDAAFARDGIFAVIRHPWYLASLILLWSALPVYSLSATLAAAILSLYLIVGTVLEERKLVAEFGELYRAYQREVSMLIPWKWLCAAMSRKHR